MEETKKFWFSGEYGEIKKAVDGASVCTNVRGYRPILQCVCIETKDLKDVLFTATDSAILTETKLCDRNVGSNMKLAIKCNELKSALVYLKPIQKEPIEITFSYDLAKHAVTLEVGEKSACVFIYEDSEYPTINLFNKGYEATALNISVDTLGRLLEAFKKSGCDFATIYVNKEPMKPSIVEATTGVNGQVNGLLTPCRIDHELRHSNITIKS